MTQQVIYGLILIATVILSGGLALKISKTATLQFILVFTGGYLFSITVVHLLPEVYQSTTNILWMGIMVLVGFFLQQILEFFTSGVEHGHIHEFDSHHSHKKFLAINVVLALCLHSILEGTLLKTAGMETMLVGILLHKAPAAYALVTVLKCHHISKKGILIFLTVFAISSPLGIILGHIPDNAWNGYIMALVAGSFLQISTTIVFETSADHKFNFRKLTYSLLGALLAVLSEMYLM